MINDIVCRFFYKPISFYFDRYNNWSETIFRDYVNWITGKQIDWTATKEVWLTKNHYLLRWKSWVKGSQRGQIVGILDSLLWVRTIHEVISY